MMNHIRRMKLSESAICSLYRAGISRTEICARAGLPERELSAVLRANGVPLLPDTETLAGRRRPTLHLPKRSA